MSKVCLIVIDGWGVSDDPHGNAILNAKTPVMDGLAAAPDQYLTLDASGLSVGLPDGLSGQQRSRTPQHRRRESHLSGPSSESIWTSRPATSRRTRTSSRPATAQSPRPVDFTFWASVSDGGVHAHIEHIFALLERTTKGNTKVAYGPSSSSSATAGTRARPAAPSTRSRSSTKIAELKYGSLATVIGRYYAMDRDKRDERIKIAFEGLVQGIGTKCDAKDLVKHMQSLYNAPDDKRQTDEFFMPIITELDGRIRDGDTIVFCNFRADRARQLSEALGIKPNFETPVIPKDIKIYCMTQYKKEYPFALLYPPTVPKNVLAEWLAEKKQTQFHCVRDGEVRPRHLLLQRWPRESLCGGGTVAWCPRPKVATLRPLARDEQQGRCRRDGQGGPGKEAPLRHVQLRPRPTMVGHTGGVRSCRQGSRSDGRRHWTHQGMPAWKTATSCWSRQITVTRRS
uniref:phosphoglycerate mutase (2,3-diphosphoglycerate-independent) n=1 Tax=Ixodes ricinus TaxID=34613 RepID=A0A090XA27_IXORI